jgi:hypothetical protein
MLLLEKTLYSEKMMNPASKIPPNRMSAIRINIGIVDSSFDESFFSFIYLPSFPPSRHPSRFSFGELLRKISGKPSSSPANGADQYEQSSSLDDTS